MRGKTPQEWGEQDPLGPFDSESQARKAIHADVASCADGSEMLSPGRLEGWAERYHLLEYIKGFQPVLDVSVKISLANDKSDSR